MKNTGKNNNKKNRLVYIEILNIVACFSVILLHMTPKFFAPDTTKRWYFTLAVQSICIFAVPLFFTLSGATLMNYRARYSTKEFLKKRIIRIAGPFLIWSVIYAVWGNWVHKIEITGFADFMTKFAHNEILSIFWFFYVLIPMYFCIPVLSLVFTKDHLSTVRYFFCVAVFTEMLIPLWDRFVPAFEMSKWKIPIANSALAYFALGWLLMNDSVFEDKKVRRLVYAGGILSVLCNFLATAQATASTGKLDKFLITTNSVTSMLIAGTVFLLVKNTDWNHLLNSKIQHILSVLASASFGIYLIQKIFIFYMENIPGIDITSPYYTVIGGVLLYAVSAVTVLFIKQIPLLKRLIP